MVIGESEVHVWADPRTGLLWQCESPGEMIWPEALRYALSLSLDNCRDWRLPTIRELETLLDRSKYRPVMFEDIPFRDNRSYWSSTTFGSHTTNAWIVMFEGAYVLSYYKSNRYYVRCVRSGEITDNLRCLQNSNPADDQ